LAELGERIWDVADYIIPPQVVRRFDKEEVQAWQFTCPLTPHWCHHHLRGLQTWLLFTPACCVHCLKMSAQYVFIVMYLNSNTCYVCASSL